MKKTNPANDGVENAKESQNLDGNITNMPMGVKKPKKQG